MADADSDGSFSIGTTSWLGCSVCQRCVVPSGDANSGEAGPHFARTFAQRRQSQLPDWAPRAAFDHFYRLAINTKLNPGQSAVGLEPPMLRVGDRVTDRR